MKIALVAYLVGAILFAWWNDAMDARYRPDARGSWMVHTAVGLLWPMSLPMGLISLITTDGRWSSHPAPPLGDGGPK